MLTAPVLEQMLHCHSGPVIMNQKLSSSSSSWRPHLEMAPNCPRCASANTKFCYYNNYSLSQPRYFCKGCRRYWTKGGSLRNVPVGGGCRKNRHGRSVRLSQDNRASLTYYRHNNSSTSSGDDLSDQQSKQGGANGPDIDLAAVFANFLNHNSGNGPDSARSESIPDEANGQNSSTPAAEDVRESVEVLHHDLSIDEFGTLKGLLGEDEDVFWSGSTTSLVSSSTTSFTWQEFDNSFPSDDDDHMMKNSTTTTNLCSDNWSSFDFSGLEVFSGS